jgi:hypothetical protein
VEVPQGNSLCSYLKQKCPCFSSFLIQIGEQEARTDPDYVVGTRGGGGVWKCWKRVNMMQILCTHACKWKNDICWNWFRNVGDGGVKDSIMKYLIYCKNFCKGHNLPLLSTTTRKISQENTDKPNQKTH